MKESEKVFQIKRYDLSEDRSLKPYSAADEYLFDNFVSGNSKPNSLGIYHDRFGFLTCYLHNYNPITVLTNYSQRQAIEQNCTANKLPSPTLANPLSPIDKKADFALLKVPKSLALFELYLEHITQNSTDEVKVVAAFMTRHFTPKLIQIAKKYFESVEQSRAVKKARLMTFTNKKNIPKQDTVDVLYYKDQSYKQYWGVFSSKHIDYATQYFLDHMEIRSTEKCILDLASGNGILAKEIFKKLPKAEIHLLDDSYLAVESAKLNVQGAYIYHHLKNNLSNFEDNTFDLIVTNPPFHFEYEINIKIPLQLFKECFRCLKANGSLQIVANKHLNYGTHLSALFSTIQILAQNDKFIVYKCVKGLHNNLK